MLADIFLLFVELLLEETGPGLARQVGAVHVFFYVIAQAGRQFDVVQTGVEVRQLVEFGELQPHTPAFGLGEQPLLADEQFKALLNKGVHVFFDVVAVGTFQVHDLPPLKNTSFTSKLRTKSYTRADSSLLKGGSGR